MQKQIVSLIAGLGCALQALAHEGIFTPDSHGPAGVMVEHTHEAEAVMTGYRYLRSSYSGMFYGSDEVGAHEVGMAGFSMMPTAMTMEMIMLDIMYAPTDRLTLMLMPMYMQMDMDMTATGINGHGDAMPGMDDMGGMHDMPHSHGTSGFGDTHVSALYSLVKGTHHNLIATLGVSIPTGKVDKKNADGSFVHYGMQLGSGTWDATPSITYTGHAGIVSWGLQGGAIIRLEDKNDSGYALGDKYEATAWSALRVLDWLSVSARVAWSDQDAISGHYNGAHNHASPSDLQANYGGEFLDAGVGINIVVAGGNFTGLRFGLEWITRIEEDYNGYQLGLDDGINASISYAF